MSKQEFTEMSADLSTLVLECRTADLQQLQKKLKKEIARSVPMLVLCMQFSSPQIVLTYVQVIGDCKYEKLTESMCT
jgi:hypothetical protein